MVRHKEQRVAVFIDVQNMYYSAKQLYECKVNFTQILKEAVSGRRLVRALAYAIKTEIKEESVFHEALTKIGFEVKLKDLQVFYGGAKKGDWDIGIAMDIVRMVSKVDVIVLVSGDGDFKELLEWVKANGCRAEVMSFGRTTSNKLKDECDMFIDMDKDKKKYLISMKKHGGPRPERNGAKPAGPASDIAGPEIAAASAGRSPVEHKPADHGPKPAVIGSGTPQPPPKL